MTGIKKFIQDNMVVVVFGVIALVVALASSMMISINNGNVSNQEAHIAELENQISLAEVGLDKEREAVVKEATGVDANRKARDERYMRDIVSTATTWSDFQAYQTARRTIINDYGIAEDSDFMQVFMPDPSQYENSEGESTNEIDSNKLNMSFDSMETYVSDIVGEKYSYVSIARIKTRSLDQDATADTYDIIIYTTNEDGSLDSMTVHPISGSISGAE